ncbi:MAG: PD-(D/E)XK nuclease family transposase, partial [Clostridiales Family XIII bacterium]|nr:PD-(D/E)XK nuclease family transposase [Clostridiales Family XIII bacterium]
MLKVTNVLPHSATKPPAISPLADPIVEAIFIDEVSAGLAAASLVDAVLKKDGVRIGQILKVTPQRSHKQPSERGCRVDVEITTDANERVLVEVQLYSDRYILQRNLFSASAIFAETSNPGDTSYELAKNMPRVISINLLNVNIRDVKENSEYLQPVKLQYV